MSPAERLKLARLENVAKALKEAATAAWSKGHIIESGRLYLRADIAESRAHYFELGAILKNDVDAAALFRNRAPFL